MSHEARQSLTGSRTDLRLEGLSDARAGLRDAVEAVERDGVGTNLRDGWAAERTAKWHTWAATLREMEREMLEESIRIDEEGA